MPFRLASSKGLQQDWSQSHPDTHLQHLVMLYVPTAECCVDLASQVCTICVSRNAL